MKIKINDVTKPLFLEKAMLNSGRWRITISNVKFRGALSDQIFGN